MVTFFALVFNFALVHLVNAEHAFHQCGLTGAVFTHQRHDLTGAKLQLGVIQRFDAGEGLTTPFITRRYSDIPQSLLVVQTKAP